MIGRNEEKVYEGRKDPLRINHSILVLNCIEFSMPMWPRPAAFRAKNFMVTYMKTSW